jgi:flagellin
MGISINTNVAATRAGMYLASNHANLQKSLDRLSSGRRITEPADDAGGLAVSMKLEHVSKVLTGASHNISNAISLLQVQDGILDTAGKIVTRMGELQGMATDVTKNSSDIDNYELEFNDLREQLYDLTQTEFNGIRLFGDWQADGSNPLRSTAANAAFPAQSGHADVTLNVIISEDGITNVTVHRSLLGGALMVDRVGTATFNDGAAAAGTQGAMGDAGVEILGLVKDPAVTDANDAKTLEVTAANTHYTAAAFTQALENIATLRATNGGQVQRLMYAQANVDTQVSNLIAANGRIVDVDIAAESSNLAKQQVLVQAAASMTAQANVANDVALMLLQ